MGHPNEILFFRDHVDVFEGPVLEVGSRRVDEYSRFWRKSLSGRLPYTGADVQQDEGVDVLMNIGSALQVSEVFDPGSFGTVFCCSVLQHVPRPWEAAANLEYLLRPGGRLCITVPFVWRWSGHPKDYWRMTAEGLEALFSRITWDRMTYSSDVPGETSSTAAFQGVRALTDAEGRTYLPRTILHALGTRNGDGP